MGDKTNEHSITTLDIYFYLMLEISNLDSGTTVKMAAVRNKSEWSYINFYFISFIQFKHYSTPLFTLGSRQ